MKEKILVVDDEEVMRRSLADILRLEGYIVQTQSSGWSALDCLRRDQFALMILDLKMPGMDGIEVMRRATRIAPDTQIILLTAHGSMESAIEALRHEAFDYLLKPSTPEQILESVRKGLERRSEDHRKQVLLEQLDSSLQELRDVNRKVQPEQTPYEKRLVPLGGGVMIDLSRREIVHGNKKVALTPTEGKLMGVFLENRNQVMTHRELVFLVQGYEVNDWEAPEVLRPLVSRLRHKLSQFPDGEKWISNVRGTGYVMNIEEGKLTDDG